MKKLVFFLGLTALLWSCSDNKDKAVPATTDTPAKSSVDLPYTASYTSNWSANVSDADLKMVLMTYKDWADNNMSGLSSAMADTVVFDMSSGDHKTLTKTDLAKLWTSFRDSLSSVRIDMQSWQKMYATDKKESYIVTWYDEYDTFKGGKVDSASYHDINQVKDGKIIWYAQYKRPKK